MKIATYNVNGVNGRLPVLLGWLEEAGPDVVCLQELKVPQEKFPPPPSRSRVRGGLAGAEKLERGRDPCARSAPKERRRALPGERRPGSRYIEARSTGYDRLPDLPNGNPAPGPKFDDKLAWFEAFTGYASDLIAPVYPSRSPAITT